MATRRTTGSTGSTGSTRTTEPPQPPAPPADKAPARRRATPVSSAAAPQTGAPASVAVSEETRRAMIAQAAYLRAERRGFAPGGEAEDWLAAEAEVDALLKAGQGRAQ
jgi:hypothetical protein